MSKLLKIYRMGKANTLIEAVNLIIDYVDKFKDRAVMENFRLASTSSGSDFFFIEQGQELAINEGTLMERRVSAIGLFLVKLGMQLGISMTVQDYHKAEKLICVTLTPIILKNMQGKGIPKQSKLIGYGMMKFVFRHGDKVYKYYYNKSLTDSNELILEPYVMKVLNKRRPDLFVKVLGFENNVLVEEYIEGVRLDELLTDPSLDYMHLKAHAVDTFEIIKTLVESEISLNDLGALNLILNEETLDLMVVDADVVLDTPKQTTGAVIDGLVDSLKGLEHGRDFSANLLSLLHNTGVWGMMEESPANTKLLMNQSNFINKFSNYL